LTNFVATPPGLSGPKLVDSAGLGSIEAFYEAVSQKSARLAWQSERFLCNLLNGHGHEIRIPRFVAILKTLFLVKVEVAEQRWIAPSYSRRI
jgi:hypothetical protein